MKRLLVCLLLVGVVGCEQPAPAPIAPNKAISEFNKAISEFNKAISEFYKGIDFGDREDWATAIACFTAAIRIDPDFADAYYNLTENKTMPMRQDVKWYTSVGPDSDADNGIKDMARAGWHVHTIAMSETVHATGGEGYRRGPDSVARFMCVVYRKTS